MRTISIHGLEPELDRALRQRALRSGKSINRTVKEILEAHLAAGSNSRRRARNHELFADLFGTWTEEEAAEFDRAVADLRRIDPKDWT